MYKSMLTRGYFQNKDDILLLLAHDGFVFYAAKKKNAWILIVIVLNISPQERVRKWHMLPVMIIPEKPKDISSFLVPFVEELERLQDTTYKAQRNFNVHLLLTSSDLMRALLLIGLKEGVGALSSCRACHLLGYPTVTKKVALKYSTRSDHANHHEPSSKRPSKFNLSKPDHDILSNPEPNDCDEPEYQKGNYYFPMKQKERLRYHSHSYERDFKH